MKDSIKVHIDSISIDAYISHINSEFITYASNGVYNLGFMGGCYVVMYKKTTIMFSSMQPFMAFQKYKELLTENN